MRERRRVVSVIGGSREDSPDVLSLAADLGRAIKRGGWHLACGGMSGVMEAVCRGFQTADGPGLAIGILISGRRDDANAYLDVVLPTSLGLARNALVVQAGDAVVAVGGESGTLSEIALAWQYGCPVVGLVPAGGFGAELAGRVLDRRRADSIRAAASVADAVAILKEIFAS